MRGFLIPAAIACCASLPAQEGFQFGAKALPTWAWFLNEDDEGGAEMNWAFGIGASYHLNDAFGLGLDLIWSTETQVIDLGGSAEWENDLAYLKIPLLIHFNSDAAETVPFLGYFGLQYVILRDARCSVNGMDIEEMTFTDANGNIVATDVRSEDLFRPGDFGVVVGLGPGWNINERFQLTAILRGDYQFNDPEDKDAILFSGDRPRTSLVTWGIDLGLKVKIGGRGG